ncbi:MFS transporter [Sphaerisporangium sp. NPDC051011]|uniref:MFS transporter n=1 Tax=Sphaerisporangium sp. NPDC051011 TaxID=3155792 RepID=UPI0033E546E3
MRARLPLRLARSAAFTVVCVSLAVLGHRAAGGSGPASWAVAGGAAAVTALATIIAGRERSPQTVIGFLVGTQVFLHLLFGAASGDGSELQVHLGHGQSLGADLGMVIAHLTATLITGWWLARGEAALWSMLRRLGTLAVRRARRLLTILRATPVRRWSRRGAACHLTPAPVRRELRHSVRRRGPPLPAAS